MFGLESINTQLSYRHFSYMKKYRSCFNCKEVRYYPWIRVSSLVENETVVGGLATDEEHVTLHKHYQQINMCACHRRLPFLTYFLRIVFTCILPLLSIQLVCVVHHTFLLLSNMSIAITYTLGMHGMHLYCTYIALINQNSLTLSKLCEAHPIISTCL